MRLHRLPTSAVILLAALGLSLVWIAQGSAQEDNQKQIEEGARLYAENCAVCHGPDGKGRIGATLAKNWPSIRPDLRVKETIQRGVSGSPMPAWGQEYGGPLSDAQVDALVAFILSWETGGPPRIFPTLTPISREALTPPPNVSGDPNNGAVLYDRNCQVCHGPNGSGRIGATLAKDWPSIRPDLEIKTTISRGVSGSPMPAWSHDNGGPLTEQQIDDLVAFVLTWSTPDNPATITPAPSATPVPASGLNTQQTWVIIFLVAVVLVGGAAIAVLSRR
jgi:mono/diheme cytochrome c family protein